MVNRDQIIKKLPMLMVDGPTTKAENRREFQNNRKKMMKLRRRDPRTFDHFVNPIFKDLTNLKVAIQNPTVASHRGWEQRDFEFNPAIENIFNFKKRGR
jgi:hypothetical protein